MQWTEHRTDELKRLWQEGLSASQVAKRLGGVTRNAVLGRLHRLGLSGRTTVIRLKPKRQIMRSRRKQVIPAAAIQPAEPIAPAMEEVWVPPARRRTLTQLDDCQCRWIVGDPKSPNYYFCDAKRMPGSPYCAHHMRVAYQLPEPLKREAVSPEQRLTAEFRLFGCWTPAP